jgi:hypothetical protein
MRPLVSAHEWLEFTRTSGPAAFYPGFASYAGLDHRQIAHVGGNRMGRVRKSNSPLCSFDKAELGAVAKYAVSTPTGRSQGIETAARKGHLSDGRRSNHYIPLCYDAVGAATYLRVILESAALHAQGMNPDALHAEVEQRYRSKTYTVPQKAGLSYMVAPVMRTIGPPDMKVHTMAMPHFMFYAPGITNADIGAVPDLGKRESLMNPFIDKQGIAEQSYFIQMVGETEARKIDSSEKLLVRDLCRYRDILCLAGVRH